MSNEQFEGKIVDNPKERNEFVEKQLHDQIDGTTEYLQQLKKEVASGKLNEEQCIDIINKLKQLYVEMAGLLPENRLEPKE